MHRFAARRSTPTCMCKYRRSYSTGVIGSDSHTHVCLSPPSTCKHTNSLVKCDLSIP